MWRGWAVTDSQLNSNSMFSPLIPTKENEVRAMGLNFRFWFVLVLGSSVLFLKGPKPQESLLICVGKTFDTRQRNEESILVIKTTIGRVRYMQPAAHHCSEWLLTYCPDISSKSFLVLVKPPVQWNTCGSGLCHFCIVGFKVLVVFYFSCLITNNWILRLKMTLEPLVEDGKSFEAQALEKLWSRAPSDSLLSHTHLHAEREHLLQNKLT